MLCVDLQRLAIARVAYARILFAAERYEAACYLAGLAVECALKARIARATAKYSFPDRRAAERAFTHDLNNLLSFAGLRPELEQAPPSLQQNWDLVSNWSVDVRHKTGLAAGRCRKYLCAVTDRGGVLPWLKQRW
jgi:HEPN domain-containing protein